MTYSVDELQRAARALQAGQFRLGAGAGQRRRQHRGAEVWRPDGPVIAVVGVGPRVGTTTVALAIAESFGPRARLVETAPMRRSGIAHAAGAELGLTENGWRRSERGDLLVERLASDSDTPDEVPCPEPTTRDVTVIDIGWDIEAVRSSWLGDVLTSPLVLVAKATLPDVSAAERVLREIESVDDAHLALVGMRRRRLSRIHRKTAGPAVATIAADGRLHGVRASKELATCGLTARDLPAHIVRVGHELAARLEPRLEGHRDDHHC